MSHWPRRLNTTRRLDLIADLRRLADELEREHAERTQRTLHELADPTPIASPSGPGNSRNGSSTETKALHGTDPTTTQAAQTLRRLHRITHDIPNTLHELRALRPDRPVALCPRCDHPLDRDTGRCQQVIDGARCGTRAGAERRCKECDENQPVGKALRAGMCNTCRMAKTRAAAKLRSDGRVGPVATTDRIQLQDNTITATGNNTHDV
jgi:hypothetical protein